MTKAGFAKTDVTPRVGVELCGFGPYRNRHSIAVRDRLWARAAAFNCDRTTVVVVSCDLVGVCLNTTRRVRQIVAAATQLSPESVMVHCTHTHSGPATIPTLIGWGDPDMPYLEMLPDRIAEACIQAVKSLVPCELHHAEVPCENIGVNREHDRDAPPLEEALDDAWRPAKPELTDTRCHVITAQSVDTGDLIGFMSYFGCHPVVCCADTRYIHGDYCGVATNLLEHENPGVTGLFLQGAQGDVNTCVLHKPEQDSLLALDVIAARYARSVRQGLRAAAPIAVDRIAVVSHDIALSRKPWTLDKLQGLLAEQDAVIHAPGIRDDDRQARMATVYRVALLSLVQRKQAGENLTPHSETQGIRLGPIALLAGPFEIFQAIKTDVVARAAAPIPLVLGITNDLQGYVPERAVAERGGYAADMVPLMLGEVPFANAHDELVDALLRLDTDLAED